VAYEEEGDASLPPLLLLHGFGVGSHHFAAQLEALSATHRVFALDFLGQGESWPAEGEADGLGFSAELWLRQTALFVEQVVGGPCFVAGNSLGGFVATYLAAARPDLVRALVLLNATPFWSSAPNPEREPEAAANAPWDGVLPAPWPLRLAVGLLWTALRQRWAGSWAVRTLLRLVYRDESAVDVELVDAILAPTARRDAPDVFASILFSPRAPLSFDEMLARRTCPVCLIYGQDDPWVVPLWGQRLKRRVPDAVYYELSPAGHCPHHEQPEAVNLLLSSFLRAMETGSELLLPCEGESMELPMARGGVLRVLRATGAPRNAFEIADAQAEAARLSKS